MDQTNSPIRIRRSSGGGGYSLGNDSSPQMRARDRATVDEVSCNLTAMVRLAFSDPVLSYATVSTYFAVKAGRL